MFENTSPVPKSPARAIGTRLRRSRRLQIFAPKVRRLLALLVCCIALALGNAPGTRAAQSGRLDLEREEAELSRLLEAAQQSEAETLLREAEAGSAREKEREQGRREAEERAAAVRREREQKLLRQIDAEVEVEGEMFERQQRNQSAISRDVLGAHALQARDLRDGRSDPRLAPGVPEVRDLPRAIFSGESVTIAPGTAGFNNNRKLKVTRLSLDADRDGTPEIVRYLDRKTKAWLRQEEDRNYDGRMDSFLRFEGKRLVERFLDNNDDGQLDIFEHYADGLMVSRSLDRDDDGVVDAYYDYEGKFLARERHDANNDSKIDLVIDYRGGRRVSSEEDTDRNGRTDTWIRYRYRDGFETISHIDSDKAGRGFADTFETFETLDPDPGRAVLKRREEDLDGDGSIDMVSIYRKGKLVRRNILHPEVVPL